MLTITIICNILIVGSVQNWLNAIDLTWPDNKDPADRIITAYAIQKKASIVTSDLKIKHFYPEVIW